MSVWFTSDLHLGHKYATSARGFSSVDEHDATIVENINSLVNKRDKLFILGDLAFTDQGLKQVGNIICKNIEFFMGNHDKFQVRKYLQYVNKIHGFRGYKNYWLSHCPIHPDEMRRKVGNIHGHIHEGGDTPHINDSRYFCVNPEFHNMKPVSFEEIDSILK